MDADHYVVVFSFGEALWSSRFLEYVANLAPAGQVGAYMGLAGIPWFLAKMTTGLYSGAMIQKFIPQGGPLDSGTMWFDLRLHRHDFPHRPPARQEVGRKGQAHGIRKDEV